jgi:hypothetical protein
MSLICILIQGIFSTINSTAHKSAIKGLIAGRATNLGMDWLEFGILIGLEDEGTKSKDNPSHCIV